MLNLKRYVIMLLNIRNKNYDIKTSDLKAKMKTLMSQCKINS